MNKNSFNSYNKEKNYNKRKGTALILFLFKK